MSDMPGISDVFSNIISALRGGGNTMNPVKNPADMSLRGYQLYCAEQKAQGEQCLPYEQWQRSR